MTHIERANAGRSARSDRQRFWRALTLLLILVVPIPHAQALNTIGVSAIPSQLIARAEALQNTDPPAALKLVQAVLVDPRADTASRRAAIDLRCWLSVTLDIAQVPAQATQDLAGAERANDAILISRLHACRGYVRQIAANDYSGASQDFDIALAMGQRAGDAKSIAQASVLRGELRYYFGDTARALTDMQLAYRLQQKLGDNKRALYALNAIANLYADERVGEYDKAIAYYRQILAIHQAEHGLAEASTAHFNIASTLERKGDLLRALDEYRLSLEIEQRRGDQSEIAAVKRALGADLTKLDRAAEALPLFDDALAIDIAAADEESAAAVRLSRGIALRKLGKLIDAETDLQSARDYFTRDTNLRFLEKIESERALTFAAANDWQQAYAALNAESEHRIALAKQLNAETTARMRVAFDTEKTENENKALARENALRGQSLRASERIDSLQRLVIALSVAIMLLLVGLMLRSMRNARRMRDLAMIDELTRLPNRRRVFQIADREAGAARASNAVWCLLALDIDHFKTINDRYGHDAGDVVLVRVAQACNASVRDHDVVGRVGGEEFLVVLPRATLGEACEVAERLRAAVEALDLDDIAPGLRTSVSVGVAQRQPSDAGVSDLAKRADECLYAAKAAGRNRVVSRLPLRS